MSRYIVLPVLTFRNIPAYVVVDSSKYTVAFFDEEDPPEYANVKYDTPQEAQRFADAANEMVRGNIYD